ncbi:MAG: Asp-tRNA(Asn)/Glu-tRNA(Gln) amidotransferase subunit GatC [Candidatus Bathyarchaeia archaeon]
MERHITKKDVEHIAWLARLELSEDEKELFTEQLNEILEYFRLIDEAETEGIPPTYHVLELANVFREDVVQPSLPKERVLQNAPRREKGYFKAPKIV